MTTISPASRPSSLLPQPIPLPTNKQPILPDLLNPHLHPLPIPQRLPAQQPAQDITIPHQSPLVIIQQQPPRDLPGAVTASAHPLHHHLRCLEESDAFNRHFLPQDLAHRRDGVGIRPRGRRDELIRSVKMRLAFLQDPQSCEREVLRRCPGEDCGRVIRDWIRWFGGGEEVAQG